ncbi:MAG TPA: DUF6263 family protein [Lacipirellulaceae bacterium]|nr:DUF6263 family protein [Lacipirellulaceae bacterium]
MGVLRWIQTQYRFEGLVMRINLIKSRPFFVVLVAFGNVAVASFVYAAEPLRWKFKVGEKLNYDMVQDMTMSVSGPQIPQMNTSMHQTMNMTWDVQGVDEKSGEAVIRQKFDRLAMKMTSPLGGFDYDSKSDQAPTGLAAMIAPMYKAMTDNEFEITMTARGEVKDVKIPPQVLTALKSSPGAASMGEFMSPDGFKKMISQGALVLPKDPPKKGDTWSTKVEMKNPAFGVQTVQTTYTYEGMKDIKGTEYAVIHPKLTMKFDNQPKPAAGGQPQQPQQQQVQMNIKDQSSDGQVLFNAKAGRLQSTTLKQDVTIDATVSGHTMQQKIEQKIDVTVTPAGESKPGGAKKAEVEKK